MTLTIQFIQTKLAMWWIAKKNNYYYFWMTKWCKLCCFLVEDVLVLHDSVLKNIWQSWNMACNVDLEEKINKSSKYTQFF